MTRIPVTRWGSFSANRTRRSGTFIMSRESCNHQSAALDGKVKPGLPTPPMPEIQLIPVMSVQTNGGTQHRVAPDPNIVKEYAALMQAGAVFPPIAVRCDRTDYWLSDGFQRLAAAKLAGFPEIRAEVRPGTKEDAQWDSYAANATHGLRRTSAETQKVIGLALQHPNSAKLSNVQIAKYLHTAESTVRYWRDRLSSQIARMSAREVTRGGVTYRLNVKNIGKNSRAGRVTARHHLRRDLDTMKQEAAPVTRGLLAIIEKWVRGQSEPTRFLSAVEQFLWTHRAEFPEPNAGTGPVRRGLAVNADTDETTAALKTN